MSERLTEIQDRFIQQWGALGSSWGINRSMAQIHALLMISNEPISADEVMERLQISRGNVHTQLKELQGWGIAKKVVVPGERKEFFETPKDPWKLFVIISRERKRREIDPTLEVLQDCLDEIKGLKSKESQAFTEQVQALTDFVSLGGRVLDKVGRSEESFVLKWLRRLLGGK